MCDMLRHDGDIHNDGDSETVIMNERNSTAETVRLVGHVIDII